MPEAFAVISSGLFYVVVERRASPDYTAIAFHSWVPEWLMVKIAWMLGWRRTAVRRSRYSRRLFVVFD